MESRSRSVRGVTALELLVVVAVAAVLATLAVPSFGSLRRAASVSAATNQLLWALHFARSSAILNGLPVTLCLSKDDATCLESAVTAGTGWLVFYQPSGRVAARPASDHPLLHSFRLPADVTVHGTRAAITFWPVTRAGTTGTFDVCNVGATPRGRAVVVSQTGRPRVAVEEAGCAP
jgi:type IV fimbrial biogenesis protein FimT